MVFLATLTLVVNGNREILLKMYVHFKWDLLENQPYNFFFFFFFFFFFLVVIALFSPSIGV